MADETLCEERLSEAFRAGRRAGLAVAALVLSMVSFLSLLGAEKAILAIVLGVLAARGAPPASLARRLGIAAVCIGAAFVLTLAVVLVVFWGQVLEFMQLLQKLS